MGRRQAALRICRNNARSDRCFVLQADSRQVRERAPDSGCRRAALVSDPVSPIKARVRSIEDVRGPWVGIRSEESSGSTDDPDRPRSGRLSGDAAESAALATANGSLARLRGLGGEPDDEIVSRWLSQSIPIVPPLAPRRPRCVDPDPLCRHHRVTDGNHEQ
jgi:hypothetical protein